MQLTEAIILAGGKGTRLQEISSGLPKPMMPVCGRPFLDFLLLKLYKYGIKKVILSVGYKNETISSHFGSEFNGMSLIYSIEETPLGTGGAIAKSLFDTENDDVIILNGDSYFDVDISTMYSCHVKKNADITMAVKYQHDSNRFGSVSITDGRVNSFREKGAANAGFINGGIYMVNRRISAYFPPVQTFSFESDLLENHVNVLDIHPFASDGYFIDIGIPDDYFRAQRELSGTAGACR